MPKPSITQIEIGERLRERRKALGLTLADVAARMGEKTADSTVQRTEVGTQNPTLETFLAHCAAIEISPAVILDGNIPLTIRPTVQEALEVLREHIDITSVIIKNQEKELREIRQSLPAVLISRIQRIYADRGTRIELDQFLNALDSPALPESASDSKKPPSGSL